MKLRNNFLFGFFFSFLFFSGCLFRLPVALADTYCSCTSSTSDCKTFTATGASATCAKDGCAQFGADFKTAAPVADSIGAVKDKCLTTHNEFLKAEAAKSAAATKNPTEYIIPTLNVQIPGLTFIKPVLTERGIESNYLADYLTALYRFLIGASITVAIVMVMIGGFQYTLSAGGSDAGKAKTRITNATIGLILLLSVYLILYTANPDLTVFKTIALQNVENVPFDEAQDLAPPESEQGPDTSGGTPTPNGPIKHASRICETVESCAPYCKGEKQLPAASDGMAAPSDLVDVNKNLPSHTGLKIRGNALIRPFVIPALQKAGQGAYAAGYIVEVQSTYRPLVDQKISYCGKFASPDFTQPKDPKKPYNKAKLAWPGGSYHGVGVAMDVSLLKDGKPVAGYQKDSEHGQPYEDLKKIMFDAGFVRLKSEEWHFEFYGGQSYPSSTRCKC